MRIRDPFIAARKAKPRFIAAPKARKAKPRLKQSDIRVYRHRDGETATVATSDPMLLSQLKESIRIAKKAKKVRRSPESDRRALARIRVETKIVQKYGDSLERAKKIGKEVPRELMVAVNDLIEDKRPFIEQLVIVSALDAKDWQFNDGDTVYVYRLERVCRVHKALELV